MHTTDLVHQTNHFLDLLEAGDQAGVASLLDDDIVWSAPMTIGGDEADQPARGREAFGSRLGSISELMRSASFTSRRITVSADQATTFVQTRGDFVTADGRPYRNVYVFRFDWRDGRIASWEEYANPVTILRTFPEVYGHLVDGLRGSA
jgi:ketosteroid isomerase-like protein